MLRISRVVIAAAVLVSMSVITRADVKLANVFDSHMVLQQNAPIRVWGWADKGEKVTVEFGGASGSATAGDDGYWRVDLPAMKADGKPMKMTVKGNNTIELEDVLLGEVWICSGQSNMEWNVGGAMNAKEEIEAAAHPTIRLFNVPGHTTSPVPLRDVPNDNWKACAPGTVKGFTAVGYYFGRSLSKELGVPIGLIGTNWGGTRIEPWTPPAGFKAVESLDKERAFVESLTAETKIGNGQPTAIYNAMVNGLTPLSVRGAIWYQGESNAGQGLKYADLKRALVRGWRSVFENDHLSFYWVQLANFQQPSDNPAGGGWGPVREGQRRAMSEPHTGMAVIIDIGEAKDIHPRNKQDVGARLALWALANDYGKDVVYSGPLYKSHKVEGDKVIVSFDHVGGGLMTGKKEGLAPTQPDPGAEMKRWSVRGADGKWHWAQAKIEGDTVVVWADGVSEPTAVRYGYESNPVGANLYNKEGLPASPFTTVD